MRACAFFSPGLDPVLDRRKGDKDAVVSPQVPTLWAVGHAVLDREPHGQGDHAVGVLPAGGCQIGEVRVQVLATLRTVVLRIGDHQITWTPHVEIPEVVQRPLRWLVPIDRVTTARTRVPLLVATVGDDLWLRQLCTRCDPFRGIGSLRTWTAHRIALLARMFGPEQYDKCASGATRYPRYSLPCSSGFLNPGCRGSFHAFLHAPPVAVLV